MYKFELIMCVHVARVLSDFNWGLFGFLFSYRLLFPYMRVLLSRHLCSIDIPFDIKLGFIEVEFLLYNKAYSLA